MHNINWCEGDMKLADISTRNVVENDLNTRMKYIMEIIDNWEISLLQEGWQNTGFSMEQYFCMTRLDWVDDSNQSFWNVCIKFYTWKEHWK